MTNISASEFSSLTTDEKLILIYQALDNQKEQGKEFREDINDHDERITNLEFTQAEHRGETMWWSNYKDLLLVFFAFCLYKGLDLIVWLAGNRGW